jgi:hypothetical protein
MTQIRRYRSKGVGPVVVIVEECLKEGALALVSPDSCKSLINPNLTVFWTLSGHVVYAWDTGFRKIMVLIAAGYLLRTDG